jgi:monothiol glutaredoxin
MQVDSELQQRLEGLIGSDRVVLFMKGTRHFPQCGFSATVTQILDKVVPKYATVNVLSDPAIREGIKAYSEWPTIPQLYIDGKFVGGCDIVREMFQAGELHSLLGVTAPPASAAAATASSEAPKLSVSPAAARAIEEAKGDEQGLLRLEISAEFEHALSIDEPDEHDFRVDAGGITVLLDRDSASRANGVQIDFEAGEQGGFKVENPNEPPKVRPLAPSALKGMMDSGERFALFDVRTPEERQIASIPGATLLDDAALQQIEALDKDTPLVFHCHHGGRSQAAAERFVRQGFKRVYNVVGGIEAWSTTVDPTVPRY